MGLEHAYSYRNYELKSIEEFPDILRKEPALSGLNVTIPYKEQILKYLDSLEETADEIQAVNTICFDRDPSGKLIKTTGFNTDVIGFEMALRPLLNTGHTGALVLGTGGASKAVVYVLKKLNIPLLLVSTRHNPGTISYDEITPSLLSDYPVIVNTTPLGTFPETSQCPDLPYDEISKRNLLFDLVYNPAETLFIKKGMERGAAVSNGYQMLIYQAEASWKLWLNQNDPE